MTELVELLVVHGIRQGTGEGQKVDSPVPLQVAAAAAAEQVVVAAAAAAPGVVSSTVQSAGSAVRPTWRSRMCSATSVGSTPKQLVTTHSNTGRGYVVETRLPMEAQWWCER